MNVLNVTVITTVKNVVATVVLIVTVDRFGQCAYQVPEVNQSAFFDGIRSFAVIYLRHGPNLIALNCAGVMLPSHNVGRLTCFNDLLMNMLN